MRSKQKARNKRDSRRKKCNKNGVRCIEYACLTIYYVFWGPKTMGNSKTTSYAYTETTYIQCKMKIPQAEIAKICSDCMAPFHSRARSMHARCRCVFACCAWWAQSRNNGSTMKLYFRIACPYASMALLPPLLPLQHMNELFSSHNFCSIRRATRAHNSIDASK